jgi:galactokinase
VPAFRAPGRVNLIGDHTDYNDGFVLPLAIDLECVARTRPRSDGVLTVASAAFDEPVELRADGSAAPAEVEPRWGRVAAGVVQALAARGRPPAGIDVEVTSTIPVGGGMSSSAAFEVALALALCDAAGLTLSTVELAQTCQEAELLATGVPCGIMDQLSSLSGQRGAALVIDCRSLAVEPVPLPPELAVVVVDSGVPRALADTAYATRRAECEAAAARLGLTALRDATPEHVADDPRARHVVSENARVLAFADALRKGDVDALGPLLLASHASLRDDFEVSTPELDDLVAALVAAGALGARLTGAGFGGFVVALVRADEVSAVAETIGRDVIVCRAVDGAGPAS